jgi:uncharacterized protein (DUF433 family)
MTAPTVTDVGSLLYVLPSPAGGRLCLTGSGVSVKAVVYHYKAGMSAEEIAETYSGHVPLPSIYAAIAYYLANKQKVDTDLAEEEREYEVERAKAGGKPVKFTPD